jgi:alpha-tubulin suppressor-like RCC1 family protein
VPNGLKGVVDIAGGGIHSLALKEDGTVVAWGLKSLYAYRSR